MAMTSGKADPDEALHGRKAEDQRRPHGVAEAHVPAEDRSEARARGHHEEARGRARGRGAAPAAAASGERRSARPTSSRPSRTTSRGTRTWSGASARRSSSSSTNPDSAWTVDVKNGKGSVSAGAIDKRRHDARARRRGLPRDDERQGRPDEALHGRKAEDQRRRDGVAEARLPEEDRPEAGDGGACRRSAAAGRRPQRRRRRAAAPAGVSEGREGPGDHEGARRATRQVAGLAKEVGAVMPAQREEPGRELGHRSHGRRAPSARAPRPRRPPCYASTDADLVALAKDPSQAQSLYQHGKLSVDGDVRPATKLSFFKDLV